jgi:4-amino-4-deoxy-L-arabinose transferase-like glycosyltransferase
VGRWPGILLAALGLLIGLAALRLGVGSHTVSPAQVAAGLAGAILIAGGVTLALRPAPVPGLTADPRRPLRYVVETLISALDALGEAIGSPRAALAVMIPVLLLAAGLRFYHLTFQSLWLDELMTWWRSSTPDLPTVLHSVESDVWPPGYSLFIYALIRALGASDFILRYPAALAGVLAVASIYTLGRRLGSHLAGVFAALLLGILEVSIYYSQEARPYSGLILFSILSTYFWLRWLDALRITPPPGLPLLRRLRPPSPVKRGREILAFARLGGGEAARSLYLDLAAYVLFALLAAYWNYYGLVLIALQAAGAALWLIRRPRAWPALIGLYVVIGIGYLPWLTPTLADLGRATYLPNRPGGYGDELMQFLRFLFNLGQGYVLVAIGVVAMALVVDGVRIGRGKPVRRAMWLLLAGWLLLPFTLTYLRSLNGPSTLLHRYLLISLPAAALLPALALTRLPIRRWLQAGLMALAAILLLNNLVRHWDYYTRPTKAQFREATYDIARRDPALGGNSIIIATTGYAGTEQLFDYYFAQADSPLRVDVGANGDSQSLSASGAKGRNLRYIWLLSAQNKPDDGLLAALQEKFTLIDHQAFNQADVWLFQVR